MEEAKFTWLPKFTRAIMSVPEEHQAALFMAIVEYGSFGTEPKFDDGEWALKAVFESMREDIDNNKNYRENGARGGRNKKKWAKDTSEGCETPLSDMPNPPSDTSEGCETPLGNVPKHFQNASEKSKSIPNHSIPNHSIPNHSIPNRTKKREGRRFAPPTLQEVEDYVAEKGYTFDPEAFWSFYESKGWKVGRDPMKSWTAACATWQKRERPAKEDDGFDKYD